MLSSLTALIATVTLLLIGAMAGVFFAFSVSVMIGLDRINGAEAIRAMQSINQRIQNPVFLSTFVLAPIVAAITGGLLLKLGEQRAAVIFFAAAVIYLIGVFGVTGAVNVPMNDRLDKVEIAQAAPASGANPVVSTTTDGKDAATVWADYSGRWTRWNHVRTVANMLSLLLVGLGLFVWGRE